jgi:hypothetical protein
MPEEGMMKYRKKPIVIEAMRLRIDVAPEWFSDAVSKGIVIPNHQNGTAIIKTLEGDYLASKGDYIIQGVKGELYPC